MGQAEPARCQAHGLVMGPDGRCVLCRRDGGAQPGPRRAPLILICLALVTALTIGALWLRNRPRPSPAPIATPRLARNVATPTRPARQPARTVYVGPRRPDPDADRPPSRPPPPAPAAAAEDPLAARRRMDQMYREAAARQAMDQVSITVYVADW